MPTARPPTSQQRKPAPTRSAPWPSAQELHDGHFGMLQKIEFGVWGLGFIGFRVGLWYPHLGEAGRRGLRARASSPGKWMRPREHQLGHALRVYLEVHGLGFRV